MQELKVFDPLVAEITAFVAPTKQILVKDAESSQSAIEAAKTIKALQSALETTRKQLVGPYNDFVQKVNAYCHQVKAPLIAAEAHVRGQIDTFAAECVRLRRIEEAKLEQERQERERLAQEERERVEAELRAKQEEDARIQREAAIAFGMDDPEIQIQAQQEKERAEAKAELDRQAALRQTEFQQAQWDADQKKIKNTRSKIELKIVDINLIPKEYLIISVNEKAILALHSAGITVSGVEYVETFSVAIGRTTRMPIAQRG